MNKSAKLNRDANRNAVEDGKCVHMNGATNGTRQNCGYNSALGANDSRCSFQGRRLNLNDDYTTIIIIATGRLNGKNTAHHEMVQTMRLQMNKDQHLQYIFLIQVSPCHCANSSVEGF